jgi:hypothetical protein
LLPDCGIRSQRLGDHALAKGFRLFAAASSGARLHRLQQQVAFSELFTPSEPRMTCPLPTLRKLLERGLAVGLLLAAGMGDRDDDPLASPLGGGGARWHNVSQRALNA